VGETTWHLLGITLLMLLANLLFPYVRTPSGTTGRYTLRNCSCMVITSCMSVPVFDFGAEWFLGGNVLCSDLMACYWCFFIYVPNHNRFISKVEVEGFTFRVLGLGFSV